VIGSISVTLNANLLASFTASLELGKGKRKAAGGAVR
jgi:hypothetical protein